MRILFIGLGTMGAPMVANLVAGGYAISVADVDDAKARDVAENSGATAVSAIEAAKYADVVILMLPNSDIVSTVLGDHDNQTSLVAQLRPGTLIIDMGSSRPDATRANFEALRPHQVDVVDAPVSGGPRKAATGELAIMVGTEDDEVWERVREILETLGTSITRTGPVGSAHAVKVLNNMLSVIGLVGALEVLAIGVKFGLDPNVVLQVINHSTGRNHATEVKITPQVLERHWNVGFSLALTVKDIATALELAESQSVATPVGTAAAETARNALLHFADGLADQSQIAQYIEVRDHFRFTNKGCKEE